MDIIDDDITRHRQLYPPDTGLRMYEIIGARGTLADAVLDRVVHSSTVSI